MMAATLFAVMTAFLVAAHRELQEALLRNGGDRARSSAEQVARLFDTMSRQTLDELGRSAADGAVRAALRDPSGARLELARKALARTDAALGPRTVTLWSASGTPLLTVALASLAGRTAKLPAPLHLPKRGVGPIQALDGAVFSDAVVPVEVEASPDGPAGRLGWVAMRSILTLRSQNVAGRLVGADTVIAIGSASTGVWTDFAKIVPAPPVDPAAAGVSAYRRPTGEWRLGALTPIAGTPWSVWVDSPRATALAPLTAFFARMVVLVCAFAILGGLLVRTLTVRLTVPLGDITAAAEAIAGGDYSRRVPVTRSDEIGRLGCAFNTMTTRVEEAYRGIATRLAEREALEARLVEAQKMEAVGQLAGGIAHDFNNLLSAIIGYTELLRQEVDPADRRRGDLDEVAKAARRAAALTRQLLAFSRKQVLQPSLLDLNTLVSDARGLLRRLIGDQIALDLRLAGDLWPVIADASQIEQIVINLAVNARDAMPDGGRLTITTSNVELGEPLALHDGVAQPGAYVALEVADTGCGMNEETRRRIFEPFFTTKARGQGTGLGLAMVYGIAQQSGGHICVDSEPGQGAVFKVVLPRAEDPHPAARPVSAARALEAAGPGLDLLPIGMVAR